MVGAPSSTNGAEVEFVTVLLPKIQLEGVPVPSNVNVFDVVVRRAK
jgi:hypothetical protein